MDQLSFDGCPVCGSTDPRACCEIVSGRRSIDAIRDAAERHGVPLELPDPAENRIGKFHAPASGAPGTQRESAILIYPKSGIARERVLRNILDAGERGVIDEDGCAALRMIQNTYIPRRNELMHDGWIEDSGKRRVTRAGAQAAVWVATHRARERGY